MQTVAQGAVPAIGIPNSQDTHRLVFGAPYHDLVPIAEIIEPSVLEAVEGMLPALVPPYVTNAANDAVQALAVLLAGSTMHGPLFLSPTMPTQDSQAASKAYVDSMIATGGVPEVPAVPMGQVWGRQTGQWTPIEPGDFLLTTGGTMTGSIAMSGNRITNLAALPQMPNGAAPAQWVLQQIGARSLYQGTWNADTNVPDLTNPNWQVNEYAFIAVTTNPSGVVVVPAIPGIQGLTVFNGDSLIYSTTAGGFQIIKGGGLSLDEANALFLPLAGGAMAGSLTLAADPVSALEAATRQWVLAQLTSAGLPEAPQDGQIYGRNGVGHTWTTVLPLSGGLMSGPLTLAANASQALQAVPLQQVQSIAAGYVPLTGGVTVTGPLTLTGGASLTLRGNAAAPLEATPLQQVQSIFAGYAPLANPVFTGDPQAPTPATTDNDTSIATTAFVKSVMGGYLPSTGGVATGPIGVVTVPPAGGLAGSLYAQAVVPGNIGFNAYINAGATGWIHQGTGAAATYNFDPATNQFNWYTAPNDVAGSPAPLTSRAYLNARGDFQTQARISAGLTIPTDSYSQTLFSTIASVSQIGMGLYLSGTGATWMHSAAAAGGVFYYDGAAAQFAWFDAPSGAANSPAPLTMALMTLGTTGNLSVKNNIYLANLDAAGNVVSRSGVMQSFGGRIISVNNGINPSVTCWDATAGTAMGLWHGYGSLLFGAMDGGGNPISNLMSLNSAGTLYMYGAFGISYPNSFNAGGGSEAFAFQWNKFPQPQNNRVSVSVNNGAAWYPLAYETSDERLKYDIGPSTFDCLKALRALSLRQFRWKDVADPAKLQEATQSPDHPLNPVGLVAQEVVGIFPEAVHPGETGTEKIGQAWSLNTTLLMATLIGAVQQLAGRLEAVEAR